MHVGWGTALAVPSFIPVLRSEALTALFTNLKMGDMVLRNRVVMSPMTRARSDTRTRLANDKMKVGAAMTYDCKALSHRM